MAQHLTINPDIKIRRGSTASIDKEAYDEIKAERAVISRSEEINELILMYSEKLLRYAVSILQNHQDAEDVIQEVFISCLQNTRLDIKNISAWLYKMTYNKCLNKLKEIKRRRLISFGDIKDEPVTYMQDNLAMPEIMKALKHLKPTEIALLYGRAVEEQSYEELSHIMGCSAAALRKQYERVKAKAIKYLNSHGYYSVESLIYN